MSGSLDPEGRRPRPLPAAQPEAAARPGRRAERPVGPGPLPELPEALLARVPGRGPGHLAGGRPGGAARAAAPVPDLDARSGCGTSGCSASSAGPSTSTRALGGLWTSGCSRRRRRWPGCSGPVATPRRWPAARPLRRWPGSGWPSAPRARRPCRRRWPPPRPARPGPRRRRCGRPWPGPRTSWTRPGSGPRPRPPRPGRPATSCGRPRRSCGGSSGSGGPWPTGWRGLERELAQAAAAVRAGRDEAAAEQRRLSGRVTELQARLAESQRNYRALRRSSGQVDPAVAEAVGALARDLDTLRRATGLAEEARQPAGGGRERRAPGRPAGPTGAARCRSRGAGAPTTRRRWPPGWARTGCWCWSTATT